MEAYMETIGSRAYKEIYRVASLDSAERDSLYQTWLESGTEIGYWRCFQLAVQLRKKRLSKDAYNVSKALTEKKPSLKSFNMYLITAYDLCISQEISLNELKDIFDITWGFSKDKEFEPNIVATLLKCCNRLIEASLLPAAQFDQIYSNWDEVAEQSNSFILAQYYLFKISQGEQAQVVQSYECLPQELKSNITLTKIYKQCTQSTASNSLDLPSQKILKKATIISNQEIVDTLVETLSYFNIHAVGISVSASDIANKLNKETFKSSFAAIVIPVDFSNNICAWSFILGYCVHKFGRNGCLIFAQDVDALKETPLSSCLTEFSVQKYLSDMDVIKLLGEKSILSAVK